jgi:DNA topoisomerase-1
VLDRLVGYNLSPLLWKKVKSGLSAGRCQSVALRLICEREREVENFIPEEYWTLEASFTAKSNTGKNAKFTAELVSLHNERPSLKNEEAVKEVQASLEGKEALVSEVRETNKTQKPKPPFTTSQLQQAAASRLGFPSRKTMQIAQQLYEGVSLGTESTAERVGLITYMRTDSVRLSKTALEDARAYIREHYPKELPEEAQEYSVGKKAQDAHEAIRPTYAKYSPASIAPFLNRDQLRLYTIIWERFMASQMRPAKTLTVSLDLSIGDALFRVSGSKYLERGYTSVMKVLSSEKDEGASAYPRLQKGDTVTFTDYKAEQHFTQGPSRYNDGSIVKTLEERGIGRPATYAAIISVLLDRYYVTRQNQQLVPTVLGKKVSEILTANFPRVLDPAFTAEMETKLDEVEEDKIKWQAMLGEFWTPFKEHLD